MLKKTVEIIKNDNGVYLMYWGTSIPDIIICLTSIIAAMLAGNKKYSDYERQIILDTAEHDFISFSYVLANKKFQY